MPLAVLFPVVLKERIMDPIGASETWGGYDNFLVKYKWKRLQLPVERTGEVVYG